MPTCRSSGVLAASAIVHSGRCKLISIHAQNTGASAATTIRVFDNASAASGTELARIILDASAPPALISAVELDMHGVIAENGLYLDISTGSGTGAAVSVEFS
tara:strand:- start:727 stop:1035 length:309 start_codon:yes stop_codon:yes gene_type:complete